MFSRQYLELPHHRYHTRTQQLGLLPTQRHIKLCHLDQQGMQILPSPFHNLLHKSTQITNKLFMLPPCIHQLLFIPLQLIHTLIRNTLPLGHGLIGILIQLLHLFLIVIQIHTELFGMLEVFIDTCGEDSFPVGGVGENVFNVLFVVGLVLFVELEVYCCEGGGVGIIVCDDCCTTTAHHHLLLVVVIGSLGSRSRRWIILIPIITTNTTTNTPPNSTIRRTNRTRRNIPPTLKKRCIHRQCINRLGHIQSRFTVGCHGIMIGLNGGDEIFEIFAELSVSFAEVGEVFGFVFGFG
mmetsp:Transcript_23305/g.36468  ORF Transcript_23305/g.36468 Transcript_23305/m.36468 type:complete len:295 (+) Transcript_23305:246-1130(+)